MVSNNNNSDDDGDDDNSDDTLQCPKRWIQKIVHMISKGMYRERTLLSMFPRHSQILKEFIIITGSDSCGYSNVK